MARVDPNLGGHQPGGMQLRDDNYSQQEIDNWEMDEGNPWVGGYGPYPRQGSSLPGSQQKSRH